MPGRKSIKPRIFDIALQAGVSTATVDRVLHGRPGVKQKTVDKVMGAARALSASGSRPKVVASPASGLAFDLLLGGGSNFANEILARAFAREGRSQGVALTTRQFPRGSVAALLAALEDCRKRRPAGVVVQPIDHRSVRDSVLRLVDLGVPVVCVLTALPGVPTLGYAGLDNRAAGRAAGLLLGHLCGKRGKIGLFVSDALYRSHEERESGIRSVVREAFEHITLLDAIPTMDDPEVCYKTAKALIREQPDVAGICNVGGGNRGIEKAVLESGRARDLAYVAFNLTPLTRKALLDGTIDAVIHQDMARVASLAVGMLVAHHTSTPLQPRYIRTEIIMRENILDLDF